MPAVNPKILTWARTTAGLSLAAAARAIGLNDAYGKTGAERLAALETGENEPHRRLLVKMSQKYRRSLLVFYLNDPPKRGDRGQDFRTLPGQQGEALDPQLDALIRDLNARQNLVKSLLEDEETQPLSFIGSSKLPDGYEVVAERIVSHLGFALKDFRAQTTIGDAFSYLRQRIENRGIFVLLLGDLGSHHSAISVERFRGFAFADPIAPFVVVNDHDARVAWSFTALHELAHLWLGTTGISGSSDELEIERFCNDVAGNILLPSRELKQLQEIDIVPFKEALSQLSEFAGERKLGRAMVAYKLLKAGRITESRWQALSDRFAEDWREMTAREKERGQGAAGGPDYYVVRRHRLGPALLDLVSRSMSEGVLSPTKAGKILGVKPRNVEPLLSDIQPRGSV